MYRLKSSNKKQKGVVRRLGRLCIKDIKRTSELIRQLPISTTEYSQNFKNVEMVGS